MAVTTGEGGVSLFSALQARKRTPGDSLPYLRELLCSALYRGFKTALAPSKCTPFIHGSIFNIQFSPTDAIVLAACSNQAITGYDPRIPPSKPVRSVMNAHSDCTNCITFISDTTFASCSDDKTIRLWDLRNLSGSMYTLMGHTNWIKNIEYDPRSNKLFSVAFQDGVREWSLGEFKGGNYEESGNFVFKLNDPVRMRIAPDSSRMFVSLRQNKCVIIDRFDGETVTEHRELVEQLVKKPNLQPDARIASLKKNRPCVQTMSGLKTNERSYRSVMSVTFHPRGGDMVALRHVDVKGNHLEQELSTLYDLRTPDSQFQPRVGIEQSSMNYLKYIDEYSPDHSLDYIKECCFSRDGRILASPYDCGVRLLAVDSLVTPLDRYYDNRYFSLEKKYKSFDFEVACTLSGHPGPVLASGFAHRDMILCTGCMEGQVLFHTPHL